MKSIQGVHWQTQGGKGDLACEREVRWGSDDNLGWLGQGLTKLQRDDYQLKQFRSVNYERHWRVTRRSFPTGPPHWCFSRSITIRVGENEIHSKFSRQTGLKRSLDKYQVDYRSESDSSRRIVREWWGNGSRDQAGKSADRIEGTSRTRIGNCRDTVILNPPSFSSWVGQHGFQAKYLFFSWTMYGLWKPNRVLLDFRIMIPRPSSSTDSSDEVKVDLYARTALGTHSQADKIPRSNLPLSY